MYSVVGIVVLSSKGVSFVSTFVDLTDVVRGFLVCILIVVLIGLRVVIVVELDRPGSISSFGFMENPVRVEFLTGATVVSLLVILSIIVVVVSAAIVTDSL